MSRSEPPPAVGDRCAAARSVKTYMTASRKAAARIATTPETNASVDASLPAVPSLTTRAWPPTIMSTPKICDARRPLRSMP